MTPGGSLDYRHLHATNINKDTIQTQHSCSRTSEPIIALGSSVDLDITMASDGNTGDLYPNDLQRQPGLQASTCPQTEAQTIDSCIALGGDTDHRHLEGPSYIRTTDPWPSVASQTMVVLQRSPF